MYDLPTMLTTIRTIKLLSKPTTQAFCILYLSNTHELAKLKLRVADGLILVIS